MEGFVIGAIVLVAAGALYYNKKSKEEAKAEPKPDTPPVPVPKVPEVVPHPDPIDLPPPLDLDAIIVDMPPVETEIIIEAPTPKEEMVEGSLHDARATVKKGFIDLPEQLEVMSNQDLTKPGYYAMPDRDWLCSGVNGPGRKYLCTYLVNGDTGEILCYGSGSEGSTMRAVPYIGGTLSKPVLVIASSGSQARNQVWFKSWLIDDELGKVQDIYDRFRTWQRSLQPAYLLKS
jgi:hypothetical protein